MLLFGENQIIIKKNWKKFVILFVNFILFLFIFWQIKVVGMTKWFGKIRYTDNYQHKLILYISTIN